VDGATVISFGGTPDNPELADLAIDGDSDTAWPTDPYKKPDAIPRYKNGVGLLLQLSEATTLSAVTVDVSSSGTEVQIRSARSALPTTLSDTTALTASTRVWPGINTIEITSSTRTSYVLVWVTKLGTTEGKNVATISEITLQGPG
jgi:serine/threonine-protein kinase